MKNTLCVILSVLLGIFAVAFFTDNNAGAGVFFGLIACILLAIPYLTSNDKKKTQAQQMQRPLMNGDRIAPMPQHSSTPQQFPMQTAPQSVVKPAYAPSYRKVIGSMILYKHYKNVGIYTLPDWNFDFTSVNRFDKVTFETEPTNPYDPGAVKVFCNNRPIGYLYKNTFQDMAREFLRRNDRMMLGHISNVDAVNGKIFIDEVFYRASEPLFVCTLTGNGSEKAQDAISICDKEDILDIEFDYDKEVFRVPSPYGDKYCGNIPKSHYDELDENCTYIAIVLDKVSNGNDYDFKENIKIAVFETAE
jgi:hypothetical protein